MKRYKILIIIGIVIVGITMFAVFSPKSDYYEIKSRTNKIENPEKTRDLGYDTMAWLQVQGTNIDLPVIRNERETE